MMLKKQNKALVFGLTAVLLSGCTERGEPPSLAKRPFETASAPPPVLPVAPKASNAARVARIMSILEQSQRGQSQFADGARNAETAFTSARGSAVSSEPWITAQLALSRLIALRGPVQTALADLDNERRMLINEQPSEDEARLTSALAEVELISNAQSQTVARLTALLKPN